MESQLQCNRLIDNLVSSFKTNRYMCVLLLSSRLEFNRSESLESCTYMYTLYMYMQWFPTNQPMVHVQLIPTWLLISAKSSHFCHCSVYNVQPTPSVSFSHGSKMATRLYEFGEPLIHVCIYSVHYMYIPCLLEYTKMYIVSCSTTTILVVLTKVRLILQISRLIILHTCMYVYGNKL